MVKLFCKVCVASLIPSGAAHADMKSAALSGSPSVWAQSLVCDLTENGRQHTARFEPTDNPYTVPALEFSQNFRFKAVVSGSKPDYVKIYTYYESAGRPILLQQATYLPPTSPSPASLTGQQTLISPILGREFSYNCALVKAQP